MQITAKNIFFWIAFLFISFILNAQVSGIHTFTINEDGISPKTLCLKKSRSGFILAGTSNGLYRFDGRQFNHYYFADTIANKTVTAIGEAKDGSIFLGMQNGKIARIENSTVKLLNAEEGYPTVAITSIKPDASGTLFFATAGEGIYYYRNKRFYNINIDDGLSDNYVYDLLVNKESLVACTDKGINTITFKRGEKDIHSYTSINGLPDNIVRCLYEKDSGQCFVGMQDKGVGIYTPATNHFENVTSLKDWKYGQVNSILSTHGQLWVATEKKGLIILSLPNGNINAATGVEVANTGFSKTDNLLNDDEGNIWFTSNNNLVKTNGSQVQNIVPLTAKSYSEIHAILAGRSGNIWVNVTAGLKKFYRRNNKLVSRNYPLPFLNAKTDITSLFEDKFGHIWVGTMGKGVIIVDPTTGQYRNISEDNLLANRSVLSINGKDEQVWISGLEGAVLCKLTDANKDIDASYSLSNYTKVTGIGSNYIYSTLVDSKNRVWFATDGKGITVLDKGHFTNYSQNNGIKSTVIYNLCEDKQGNIWFSTLEGGIYKFDGSKFINVSVQQGLKDATITALTVDAKGNIIAVSKKGINIIDTKTNTISYLDENQGLEELNTDLNCITSNNNKIFFVSNKGIIEYIPSYQSLLPKVVLGNVQLFLNNIDASTKVNFASDENNLSFHFTGISFSHPEKIIYQYKLQGFSNEWTTTKDNSINFPRLPPGKYAFRVRVSLNNKFASGSEAGYSFTINKPLWLQWWFIAAVILLIAALLYWYTRVREKRAQRWERIEKEKIQAQFEALKSQVSPHFLFNSFNTLISVIEESPESAVEYAEHLSDFYRKIVTYRDNDTILLGEEINLIHDYFFIQQKRFGDNLQCLVNLEEDDFRNYRIAPLTLQLLCENAVKHNSISAETPLLIHVYIQNDQLIIRNNINKKITPEKGAGMGLQNIQKRYRLLSDKELRIEKDESEFIVYIPLLLL